MSKRRIFTGILLGMTAAFWATGCSQKETNPQPAAQVSTQAELQTESQTGTEIPVTEASVEEGLEAFVQLGDYTGLTVETPEYEVTDEEIQRKVTEKLDSTAKEVRDGKVEQGDIVNLDYKGTVGGKSFQGGESQGYDLKIGSGSFVDGFEEQLVGCHVDEETTVKVTFPEDYSAAGLRGKEAVFEVKINAIRRPESQVTDEWTKENCGFETADDYIESIRTGLEDEKEQSAQSELETQLWDQVLENCQTLQYPEDLLDEWTETEKNVYQQYADSLDMTFEEVLESCGITADDLEQIARLDVDYVLISAAICEKEGITAQSSLYQEKLEAVLKDFGYASAEEAIGDGATQSRITATVQKACATQVMQSACKEA